MPTWLARELQKNLVANIIAIVAVAIAITFGASSCNLARQANATAEQGLALAKKTDSITPDGQILGPTSLGDSTCYHTFGYKKNIPGNSSLWLSVRSTDRDSKIYVTEVPQVARPTADEQSAVSRARADGEAFTAPLQIGDDTIAQGPITYDVTLYYATSEQSRQMATLVGRGVDSLPGAVEAQHLGQAVRLSSPGHNPIPDFKCEL